MPGPPDLVRQLIGWAEESAEALRRLGVAVTVSQSESGPGAPSARVLLESTTALGEVLVWRSGHLELRAAARGLDDFPVNDHLEAPSSADLEEALRRVVAAVRAAKSPPTRDDVIERIEALLAGTLSRDDVSTWAWQWITDDDYEPMDDVVWSAVNYLGGADSPSTDRAYLYDREDFESWLADVQAGRAP